MNILDVFQKGLVLDSSQHPYDTTKRYAYVEHPTEGWRVYLRSAVFLHPTNESFDPTHFLVVKKTGKDSWEPPKGRMEGKDIHGRSVLQLLKENATREVGEEAHIEKIQSLTHTGLVFQSQEQNYPENHYFQYHIFQGFVAPKQLKESEETFEWIHEHPKGFARWKKDRREKDDIAWFHPRETRLNPRWAPDLVSLYIRKNLKNRV
jgi:hypothetical protein